MRKKGRFREERLDDFEPKGGHVSLNDEYEEDYDIDDSQKDLDYDDDLYSEDFNDGFDDFGNYDVPIEKHADLLKNLTNFAPYLKDTVNGWLGLAWNEKEGKYTNCEDIKPIMNRHCAAWCISNLKTYTRNNNIITDITGDAYKNMMADVIENVWLNIGTRADKDFGIENDGDILRICNEMEHAAALVLMGAGDGRYNQFLAGTIKSNYSESAIAPNMNNQPRKSRENVLGKVRTLLFGK